MKWIRKMVPFLVVGLALSTYFYVLIRNGNVQILNPQGYIAQRESDVIIATILIALCIGIPVIIATLFIAFRYSENAPEHEYSPTWHADRRINAIWWIAPSIIIFFWAILGWQTAHELDPYTPIPSNNQAVQIQVVALQWKWLFLYPQQHIATINYIEFPVNTPVHFELTADAPYNSFWIPSLGSQIYAMDAMQTQLNLEAAHTGIYPGQSAEMSGNGFAGMQFQAKVTSQASYNKWIASIQQSSKNFTTTTYRSVEKPSSYTPQASYNLVDTDLFNQVILKYMSPHANINI